ncbi:MAG: hypothetical protein ACREVG_07630 [Burkholderiales bacterium]
MTATPGRVSVFVCALVALGACASLWWFVAAAAAMLAWLHPTRRRAGQPHPPGMGTILSLVLYALLLSIALVTVRAALGWLELPTVPFEQTGLAPAMRRASLGFYDKSELRLALLELLLLAVTLAMVFVQSASHWTQRRDQPLVMHPMSAAFAFVLYFAAIDLPPYSIDLEHWLPLHAAATGIREGVLLRVSGYDPGEGLLGPVLFALWLSWFGFSTLSLSAAMMLGNLIAGIAGFALIRRLTGSRAVALLGAGYALLEAAATHPAAGPLPAPAQIALGLLLVHISLREQNGRWWPGFLVGLTVSWNPPFGMFAAAALLVALSYQMSHRTRALRTARLRVICAVFAGVGLSILAIWAARGAPPLPEGTAASSLPFFVPGLLYLALVLRRIRRSRGLSARYLFVGASVACAVPCTFLAPGGVDASHHFPAFWALIPSIALVIYGSVRLLALRPQVWGSKGIRTAPAIRLTPMVVCVLFVILFPIDRLKQCVAEYTTKYESERQKWYVDCASGKACDPAKKPSLASHLWQASRPIPEG